MKFPVEKISRSIVKPSVPTPSHLRHCQFSSLDQIMVRIFTPWVLLYPRNSSIITNTERCQRIKKSLSQTLTLFYPFAGRVVGNSHIECNDEGVPFVEANAKVTLVEILQDPYCHDLDILLPFDVTDPSDVIVFVQVTYLECGGMALGFGISHKIADGSSGAVFLRTWAAMARGDSNIDVPLFDAAEYFPPVNLSDFDPCFELVKDDKCSIVARKFLFNASSIEALRERYADNKWIKPTRIETLTAFACSRIKAANQLIANDDTVCSVKHVLNLRTRINPPLSDMRIGNYLYEPDVAVLDAKDNDGCRSVIDQMRKLVRKVDTEFVMKNLQNGEAHLKMMDERSKAQVNGHIVPITFSSCTGFPIYETDFGWGKPLWVGLAFWPYQNLVIMFDSREKGGIELFIYLKKEDMARLERDKELSAFVSPTTDLRSNL